jgi:hypothetical protein
LGSTVLLWSIWCTSLPVVRATTRVASDFCQCLIQFVSTLFDNHLFRFVVKLARCDEPCMISPATFALSLLFASSCAQLSTVPVEGGGRDDHGAGRHVAASCLRVGEVCGPKAEGLANLDGVDLAIKVASCTTTQAGDNRAPSLQQVTPQCMHRAQGQSCTAY